MPRGAQAYAALRLAGAGPLILVAADTFRAETYVAQAAFFAPERKVALLPAWDTDFYAAHPPDSIIVARRIEGLSLLADGEVDTLITTPKALLQRVPPPSFFTAAKIIKAGSKIGIGELSELLVRLGYERSETVCEPGHFAIRGGIADVFDPGRENPLRLDFFGDEIETIRFFDAASQRGISGEAGALRLRPAEEFIADGERLEALANELGSNEDLRPRLYALSGLLPPQKGSLLRSDYPFFRREPLVVFTAEARFPFTELHLAYRRAAEEEPNIPPPQSLYLREDELRSDLGGYARVVLSPFAEENAETIGGLAGGKPTPKRGRLEWFKTLRGERIAAAGSAVAAERLRRLLNLPIISVWRRPSGNAAIAPLSLEENFAAEGVDFVADLLPSHRLAPERRRAVSSDLAARPPQIGELMVHQAYGIGKFEGMRTIGAADGSKHDCFALSYADGDRLLLPVENFHALSRYGNADGAKLDSLGGSSTWLERQARAKNRIRKMCEELVRAAAARKLAKLQPLTVNEDAYGLFCAGFGWDETEDQLAAIKRVEGELLKSHPMEQLICGDAGFGKTEVALRAAFWVAMNGGQVAVLVPSAILARQHYRLFAERFAEFPIRVAMLSRLVSSSQAKRVRRELAEGGVDIVIGTHALLTASAELRRLGLLVIDEEHHFGVRQKERLKALKGDAHVLSLSATPIPRTLHMAFSGLRGMSVLSTPPPLRSVVNTFIMQLDNVAVLRQPLERELARGGGVFCVAPRIADLESLRARIAELMPDATVAVAHGRLANSSLEETVGKFERGEVNILVSTAIVGSGLDIPEANTLIVFNSQMFGLAQLYQLRGRVGRSPSQSWAYFTYPAGQRLGEFAEKRLRVINALDHLGVGVEIASHDLDIRGAGNLLGEEQSGRIREVGVELYQKMVREAVFRLQNKGGEPPLPPPIVKIAVAMQIPADYVAEESLRIKLYKRLSDLDSLPELREFKAELRDRFGAVLPERLENLLEAVAIKLRLAKLGVKQVESGSKGAVVAFYRPLAQARQLADGRLSNDHCYFNKNGELVVKGDWDDPLAAMVAISKRMVSRPRA